MEEGVSQARMEYEQEMQKIERRHHIELEVSPRLLIYFLDGLWVCLSVSQSVCLFLCFSATLSRYLHVRQSVCVSVCLSVCPHVALWFWMYLCLYELSSSVLQSASLCFSQ